MYSVKEFKEPKLHYYRILCPDGRWIGYFNSYLQAQVIVEELNGLKNPN